MDNVLPKPKQKYIGIHDEDLDAYKEVHDKGDLIHMPCGTYAIDQISESKNPNSHIALLRQVFMVKPEKPEPETCTHTKRIALDTTIFGEAFECVDCGLKFGIIPANPKRTNVEFVKVESGYCDLVKELRDGVLYSSVVRHDNFRQLSGIVDTLDELEAFNLYRKVEKEIDWREEVVDMVGSGLIKRHDSSGFQIGGVYFPDNEMIAMCHLVASMTDKPKGE